MGRRSIRLAGLIFVATVAAVPALASNFGIAAHIPRAEIQDEIVAAEIGWVRVDFVWALVEVHRNVYLWERFDELIDDLEARDLRIYATLGGTPEWATSGSLFSGVPDDPAEWQEFCYLVATRYRGRVDAWGLWNEPNLDRFWEGSRTQYIQQILLPGAEAVIVADPHALVAAPDLAHLQSADWEDWLDDVIWAAGDVLDVVTHHVYADGSAAAVTRLLDEGSDLPWDPPPVREVLNDTGWRGLPFWLTETGAESSSVGQIGQSNFYEELLDDWFAPDRSLDWIDRMFFYEMMDPPGAPEYSFGILEPFPGLDRKMAFYTYRDFIMASPVDDGELVRASFPAFTTPGGEYELEFVFLNVGSTTWTAADGYFVDLDADRLDWSLSGGELAEDETVPPGGTATFEFTLRVGTAVPVTSATSVDLVGRIRRGADWAFGDAIKESITVSTSPPPSIDEQPVASVVTPGGSASLSVTVSSDSELQYQWRRNSLSLEDGPRVHGATTPEIVLSGIGSDLLGDYQCVVTNEGGTVASRSARLELVDRVRRGGERIGVDPELFEDWREFRARRPKAPARRFKPSDPADGSADRESAAPF